MNKHLTTTAYQTQFWLFILFLWTNAMLSSGCATTVLESENPENELIVDTTAHPITPTSSYIENTPIPEISSLTPVLEEVLLTPIKDSNLVTRTTMIITTTALVTSTLTPIGDDLLDKAQLRMSILVIQDQPKPGDHHMYEVLLIDTGGGEKRTLMTTESDAVVIDTQWDISRPELLYVLYARRSDTDNLTWQLREINIRTGKNVTLLANTVESIQLLDTSYQSKWLRVLVSDPPHNLFETWFLHTQTKEILKVEGHFAGFAWSPVNPDIFAHSQSAFDISDSSIPRSLVIRQLPGIEVIDDISFEPTNWRNTPALLWHLSDPRKIRVFINEMVYVVDLDERAWTLEYNSIPFPTDDSFKQRTLQLSPSGEWLAIENPYPVYITVVQLANVDKEIYSFEHIITNQHLFVSWYGINDWIVVATIEDDVIQIYDLNNNLELIGEVNLRDAFELRSPHLYIESVGVPDD